MEEQTRKSLKNPINLWLLGVVFFLLLIISLLLVSSGYAMVDYLGGGLFLAAVFVGITTLEIWGYRHDFRSPDILMIMYTIIKNLFKSFRED
jgi:hypothetical protein